MRQHAEEQSRRAWQEANFFFSNARQYGLGFEHLLWVDRRTLNEGCYPACFVTKRVKEGIHNKVTVALLQANDAAPSTEGFDGGAVRSHDTFGPACGARCEHQIGGAVFCELRNSICNFQKRLGCGLLQEVKPI